jgi:hypothetical protein
LCGKQYAQAGSYDCAAYGLGDLVAALTSKLGIQPCDKCKKRRQALNRLRLK